MLRKNQPIKFVRYGSVMARVFQAVRDGRSSKTSIVAATRLPYKKVTAALYALTFAGNLIPVPGKRSNSYKLPDQQGPMTTVNIPDLQRSFYAAPTEEGYSASKNREAETE